MNDSLPLPNRRFYGWLALGFLAFVLYGSWVPFHFNPLPLQEAVARFQTVLAGPVRIGSRSDWAANILLMIPPAFCLLGALGADRPGAGWLGDAVLALPLCVGVSVTAEFGQLFLPGRVSSINDIVAQAVGAVVGALLWGLGGQRATGWGRQFWQGQGPAGPESRLLPAYVVLLIALQLLPLDLTLSPAEVYHKFKDGRVNLVPFLPPEGDLFAWVQKNILNAVNFAIFGALLAGLPGPGRGDRRQGRVLGCGVLFVGLINGLKLLVASRNFDLTDVVVEGTAVVVGWGMRLSVSEGATPGFTGPALRGGLLAAWVALLAFVTWQPFDFDVGLAGPRLKALSVLPFADMRRGPELLALQNVAEKGMLYLMLGVLLTGWGPGPRRLGWLAALGVGFFVALALEAGQLFLVSRTASLSDVYVETAGAVAGSILVMRVWKAGRAREMAPG